MTIRSMFGPGDDYAGKPGPQGGDQSGYAGVALLALLAIVAKAIDILLRDDADLARLLSPCRKEIVRAGTMRITGNK